MKTPKKLLIFSYILGNENPEKILLIFQEMELSFISGNVNPKKLLIFQEVTFRARKMKKLLMFREMELSYFSRVFKNKFIHSSS